MKHRSSWIAQKHRDMHKAEHTYWLCDRVKRFLRIKYGWKRQVWQPQEKQIMTSRNESRILSFLKSTTTSNEITQCTIVKTLSKKDPDAQYFTQKGLWRRYNIAIDTLLARGIIAKTNIGKTTWIHLCTEGYYNREEGVEFG